MLVRRVARLAGALGLFVPVACASLSGLQGGSADGGPDAGSEASGMDGRPDGPPNEMPADGAPPDAPADVSSDALPEAGPCASDASLASDPQNCGRCGHDCLGGACMGGVCQPVTLYDRLDFLTSLVVDDVNLYWETTSVTAGALSYGPKTGGTATVISMSPMPTSGLAVDDASVYWTSRNSILGCPKPPAACPSANVLVAASATAIVVDSTRLYWTENGTPGGLFAVPKAGGSTTELVTADYSSTLALGGTRLFWASGAGLETYDLAAGASNLLMSSMSVAQIAANATSVYWADFLTNALYACAPTACSASGAVVVMGSVTALAADTTSAFYATQPAALWFYTPPGFPSPLTSVSAEVVAMAVDASAVYFGTAANGISTIQRVAKP